jgi:hypothetical protein
MTITAPHNDATTRYYKRVACETYDKANGVYLELGQDHASFLLFDKNTREVRRRVKINDDLYSKTKHFYKTLAKEINEQRLNVRLKTKRWRDGRYSFAWAFYRPNGILETVSVGTQYVEA